MFGSDVLEIAIGVIFFYLVVSIACTSINEGISTVLNQRGRNLFNGIKNLLNDPEFTGLAQQVYHHGLVDGITQDKGADRIRRRPSYIASKTFSLALLDVLGSQGVVRAAGNDLLLKAEQADDLARAKAGTSDAASAKAAADNAMKALQDAATQAVSAYNAAKNATPSDDQVTANAEKTVNAATAAVKIMIARRAAIDFASNPKDAKLAATASSSLEDALSAGRDLAKLVPQSLDNIEAAIQGLPDGHTKESLLVLVDKAKREGSDVLSQIEGFKTSIETWFNDAMDRVTGWYKRWTQIVVLCISIVLVTILNVDSLMIIQRLTSDKDFRSEILANASKAVEPARSSNSSSTGGSGQTGNTSTASNGSTSSNTATAPNANAALNINSASDTGHVTNLNSNVSGQTANSNATGGHIANINGANGKKADGGTSENENSNSSDAALQKQLADLRKNIVPYTNPLGWTNNASDPRAFPWRRHTDNGDENVFGDPKFLNSLLLKLLGLAMSIAAASLGAPFWFDALSTFINIRGAGLKPGGAK